MISPDDLKLAEKIQNHSGMAAGGNQKGYAVVPWNKFEIAAIIAEHRAEAVAELVAAVKWLRDNKSTWVGPIENAMRFDLDALIRKHGS